MYVVMLGELLFDICTGILESEQYLENFITLLFMKYIFVSKGSVWKTCMYIIYFKENMEDVDCFSEKKEIMSFYLKISIFIIDLFWL